MARYDSMILISILLGTMLLAGCAPVEQVELEDVSVMLKWVHQAQFAGNYVAREKGFYGAEGLNVTILQLSFEHRPLISVPAGEVDFGLAGADEFLTARAKGLPLKAVAVIYKINPVVVYSLKGSGITRPEHLIGKRVGIEREGNVEYSYYSMLARLGMNKSDIIEVEIGYDATELLAGETDASTGYLMNEPQQAIEAGHDVNTILMAEYGVSSYADIIFTTEDMIDERPDLVRKFVSATLKGWQYAIEHEDEAVNYTLKYATDRTFSHESYMLRSSIPFIDVGNERIGLMRADDWMEVEDLLIEQGLLKGPVGVESAYTNEFID